MSGDWKSWIELFVVSHDDAKGHRCMVTSSRHARAMWLYEVQRGETPRLSDP